MAAAGFVNRTGIIAAHTFNRATFYGRPGALVQTWGSFFGLERLWDYSSPGDGAIEGSESASPSATLRGGWKLNGQIARSFFSYEPAAYAGLAVETGAGASRDTVPFTVPGRERNQWSGSLSATTPTWRRLTATGTVALGETPIFREAAPGRSLRLDVSVDLRPTAALRATLQMSRLKLDRRRDDSRFSSETIPRLKVEYQLSRALFLRFVGQYSAQTRAPLEDRFGNPVLIAGVKDAGLTLNQFRMDWLFSYRPTPGTLVYLGYGSTLEEPDRFKFRNLERTTDGFFGKLSYVCRM